MKSDEIKFINSFNNKRAVRYERGGAVITGAGGISVSRAKFVIIANNAVIFEAKKDNVFVGLLLSGNGIRIGGFNLLTNADEQWTVYFSYIEAKL